ncbi:MAG: YCF48-related protein [bacterium]
MTKAILKSLIVFTGVFCLFSHAFSQAWQWQNPLPTGNPITAIDFVDSLNGWFASSAGTILHTSDGGNNWEIQHTGVDAFFTSVDFVDLEYGWGAGVVEDITGGAIVHTSNGGEVWTVQRIDSTTAFDVITFIDRKHGWAAGQGDKIFRTADGGVTCEGVEFEKLGQPRVLSIAFVDSLRGWAGGNSFTPFLFTKDGGRSWQAETTV